MKTDRNFNGLNQLEPWVKSDIIADLEGLHGNVDFLLKYLHRSGVYSNVWMEMGDSSLTKLMDLSSIAIQNPKIAKGIEKNIDKLIEHAELNIRKLKQPKFSTYDKEAKLTLHKVLVNEVLQPAKRAIINKEIFDRSRIYQEVFEKPRKENEPLNDNKLENNFDLSVNFIIYNIMLDVLLKSKKISFDCIDDPNQQMLKTISKINGKQPGIYTQQIDNEVDKLIRHTQQNIRTLQRPIYMFDPHKKEKIGLCKVIISELLLPLKKAINNGQVFEANREKIEQDKKLIFGNIRQLSFQPLTKHPNISRGHFDSRTH